MRATLLNALLKELENKYTRDAIEKLDSFYAYVIILYCLFNIVLYLFNNI